MNTYIDGNVFLIITEEENIIRKIKFEVSYTLFEDEKSFNVVTEYNEYDKELNNDYNEFTSVKKFVMPESLQDYINSTLKYMTGVTDLECSPSESYDRIREFTEIMKDNYSV